MKGILLGPVILISMCVFDMALIRSDLFIKPHQKVCSQSLVSNKGDGRGLAPGIVLSWYKKTFSFSPSLCSSSFHFR